jgi:bifunctional non-homologous end joining protein LigD
VTPLEEYQRKRRFEDTPEPKPKIEKTSGHRFVVQKHRATRLHYDFRLEMEGVLKSWAVPKGPSLDPEDKRLAMQVEDHPVSYFDFEGIIPEGNYGAGSVMVWDVGTWQPLSPVPVQGKYNPGTEAEATAMLAKGDLKFRLSGERLKGDFALVHIRSRRSGSKGNEWLMIKKRDEFVEEGFDAEQYDTSVLTRRTMKEIAGDEGSAEWESSRPASRGKLKAAWLADAVARMDKRKREAAKSADGGSPEANAKKKAAGSKRKAATKAAGGNRRKAAKSTASSEAEDSEGEGQAKAKIEPGTRVLTPEGSRGVLRVSDVKGARKAPMPDRIQPMLASIAEDAFDSPDWLYEVKWDGYRAVAFIVDGKVRLVSRNQNDLTGQYPELRELAERVRAERAVIDGEVVAVDESGRSSFSLMQQRAGFRKWGRRAEGDAGIPILYYAFDLIYLDGYDLRRVNLEERKQALAGIIEAGGRVRFSDHSVGEGKALYRVAAEKGLEGIVAKRRNSCYEERRSREWLKIKITQTIECVVAGYTDPEGSREFFGSIVLGLYDDRGRLIHVGQAGTGFDRNMLKQLWEVLQQRESKTNPFDGAVDVPRKVHWVKPELVAEIKFSEWTHESAGGGLKLRAPVFLGLRSDKNPKECKMTQNDAVKP